VASTGFLTGPPIHGNHIQPGEELGETAEAKVVPRAGGQPGEKPGEKPGEAAEVMGFPPVIPPVSEFPRVVTDGSTIPLQRI